MVRGRAARRWWRPAVVGVLLAAALGCNKTEAPAPDASPGAGGGTTPDAGVASIQSMIDAGRLDEAAQSLGARTQDADTLYLLGRLWARKAVTAPLPTPPPALSPGGPLPPAPEFKPEEIQAIS